MLHQMSYLWVVTAIVWFVTLFYIFSLLQKQNRLERELRQLESQMQNMQETRRMMIHQ